MLFNSIDFAIFLPIVFILYWLVSNRNLKIQNTLIVVASYFFYGWWDWRFLSLIFFSTIVDFTVGLGLSKEENRRKRRLLLWTSILINLGFLSFFKYYNFFLDNFIAAFSLFGTEIKANSLNIVLPVGISFYTFQTMSYTIDVYKRKFEPTKDFIAFTAFVSFFPQLVAGPIERATHLLPQFYFKRTFDYLKATDGMRQILWGLFKKIVIADNCAVYANLVYDNSTDYPGSALVLGALFFSFQLYADFSGYSDIAIGVARLFGINLNQNFAFPFFSRNMAEFWNRWHISLTTWFRDYLFFPIIRSKKRIGSWVKITTVFIQFSLIGLWHGAKWTFVVWGMLNAIFLIPKMLRHSKKIVSVVVAQGERLPKKGELLSMLKTFSLVTFAGIFFRANNLEQAFNYIVGILTPSLFIIPSHIFGRHGLTTLIFVILFMLIEWQGREQQYAIAKIGINWGRPLRFTFYYFIIFAIFIYGGKEQQFVYFQF